MKYSIITPIHNQYIFTEQYLKCIKQLPADKFQIIIVNNNSTDKTEKILDNYHNDLYKENIPMLVVLNNEMNMGFAKACNAGYAVADGDVICFLNNDIKTKNKNWYKPIEAELEIDKDCLYGPTGGYIDNNFNFRYETNNPFDKFNYLSGWCLFGTKDKFETIKKNTPGDPKGPFIEIFTTYFEDTYMGLLCNKLQIKQKIISCPDIVHFGKVTTRTLNLSNLYLSAKQKFIPYARELNE